MSLHVTDEYEVALFDSVTGIAFGEVFNGPEDAQSFIVWLAQNDGRDARTIPAQELTALRLKWGEDR